MLSDYLDGVTTTKTHDAYVGVPLASLSSSARGDILEHVAKRLMEEKTGGRACVPLPGTRVNGHKRGRGQETCDFVLSNRRVEVKSAQLSWDTSRRRWCAKWRNIKSGAHDDLLLVLYTPSGVHVFKHDRNYGVTTTGMSQSTAGGHVVSRGPSNVESIATATDAILVKMGPMWYASLGYSTPCEALR